MQAQWLKLLPQPDSGGQRECLEGCSYLYTCPSASAKGEPHRENEPLLIIIVQKKVLLQLGSQDGNEISDRH